MNSDDNLVPTTKRKIN